MKAGYDEVPYKAFGVLFYLTLMLTFILYFTFFYPLLAGKNPAAILLITFLFWIIIQGVFIVFAVLVLHVYMNLKIYDRTKKLEVLLPDYLQLVSTNLKGGMTFERALWSAIQPEFGILAKEITMVSKKVLTGNDVSEALLEFSRKYDSPILRRSIDLIVGEIESGGKITEVIDKVIISLRKSAALKEEMAAQTLTYMIFIGAIVMVIAPALFALSSRLISIITSFSQQIGNVQAVVQHLSISAVGIDAGDFRIFSVFALSIISIFAGMIISTIEKGDIKGGLKYIPIFLITSLFFYFLFSALLASIF